MVVHEYGHALQDAQVPGFGSSPQGGAMGEGFSDYLAAGQSERFVTPDRVALEPCFAEWDSLGLGDRGDPPCLRRVDRDLTVAQVGQQCPNAEVHCVGEAWSAVLWDIRAQLGAVEADRLVIRSHFSLTANSGFQEGSVALVAADRALYGGAHEAFMRDLLVSRGFLNPELLDDTPAGATLLGAPPITANGTLVAGNDVHDVYALDLALGMGVVMPGANEDLVHRAVQAGRHFLDVTAVGGSGSYSLTVLPDIDGDVLPDGEDNCRTRANPAQTDRDRDSLGDACDRFPRDPRNDRDRDGLGANADYCPRAANRGQRDWDRDGQGDRCDRSSRLTLKVIRARGLRVTVRATLRQSLLGPARSQRRSTAARARPAPSNA